MTLRRPPCNLLVSRQTQWRRIMARKNEKLVAVVCLYGNSRADVGSGWLAQTADGKMMGTGDPVPGRSFTESVWLAQRAIREAGYAGGVIEICAAGGMMSARVGLDSTSYFGELKWTPIPVAG